jgi:hypothetical protein
LIASGYIPKWTRVYPATIATGAVLAFATALWLGYPGHAGLVWRHLAPQGYVQADLARTFYELPPGFEIDRLSPSGDRQILNWRLNYVTSGSRHVECETVPLPLAQTVTFQVKSASRAAVVSHLQDDRIFFSVEPRQTVDLQLPSVEGHPFRCKTSALLDRDSSVPAPHSQVGVPLVYRGVRPQLDGQIALTAFELFTGGGIVVILLLLAARYWVMATQRADNLVTI